MTVNETPFSTVLIANRGEIACRVIRSAKAAGLKTVAIFSDADATAPHVKMADDARRVGPPPVSESYLVIQNILAAAKEAGADAIHPGYGFLSENAAFAAACADAGIVFIGPPINAIDIMGDKAKAKRRMIEAGVPCIPGYQGTDQSDATLLKEAQTIGLPIMVKAAAGGGGRGMRLVEKMDDLENAISTARSEAENAFGSGELILEKAVLKPRHVEIQIFADRHGNVVHLGERDCSVQRRHQKVLEEAPCPVMTPDLRNAMGDAAVKAARDIDYVGAGTVEFLLDQKNKFYFLEMNTRLQVEHPVTEIVTGLDLVTLQLRVARGAPLGLQQEDVRLSGHAIEARLYAEDPSQGFLPATGVVDLWQAPSSDGIRIDAGIETGSEISPFYDPMVAKIIGYGGTREEARRQLVHALKSTAFFGPASNRSFLIDALERQAFVDGEATTAFIGECFSDADLEPDRLTPFGAAIAATLLFEQCAAKSRSAALPFAATLRNWSSATQLATPFRFDTGDGELTAAVTPLGTDQYHVAADNDAFDINVDPGSGHHRTLKVNGTRTDVLVHFPTRDPSGQTIQLSIYGRTHCVQNLNGVFASGGDAAGAGAVVAPMHGLLIDVFVKPGDTVAKGDRLAILEAMKMQHELLAEVDGAVSDVYAEAGAQIAADTLLMKIENAELNP